MKLNDFVVDEGMFDFVKAYRDKAAAKAADKAAAGAAGETNKRIQDVAGSAARHWAGQLPALGPEVQADPKAYYDAMRQWMSQEFGGFLKPEELATLKARATATPQDTQAFINDAARMFVAKKGGNAPQAGGFKTNLKDLQKPPEKQNPLSSTGTATASFGAGAGATTATAKPAPAAKQPVGPPAINTIATAKVAGGYEKDPVSGKTVKAGAKEKQFIWVGNGWAEYDPTTKTPGKIIDQGEWDLLNHRAAGLSDEQYQQSKREKAAEKATAAAAAGAAASGQPATAQPAAPTAAQQPAAPVEQPAPAAGGNIQQMLATMSKRDKQRLLTQLTSELGTPVSGA